MALPVAPRPYRDELISSWLDRVARHYHLTGLELAFELGAFWVGGQPFERRSMDWEPDDVDLDRLAAACRMERSTLRSLDVAVAFRGWPRHWFNWRGYRLPSDASDFQWGELSPCFCRSCLRSDVAAGRDVYVRSVWATVLGMCQIHREPLVRSCGSCGVLHGERAEWSLERCLGRVRYRCHACRRFVDESPSLERPRESGGAPMPPSPEQRMIDAAWDRVTRFETEVVASLNGLARGEPAPLVAAVEDLAFLLCRPSGDRDTGVGILARECCTTAFPVPSGFPALATAGDEGQTHWRYPLGFIGLPHRQALMSAVEHLVALLSASGGDEGDERRSLCGSWFGCRDWLIYGLGRAWLEWIDERSARWPADLRQGFHSALEGVRAQASPPDGDPGEQPSLFSPESWSGRGRRGLSDLHAHSPQECRRIAASILENEEWKRSSALPWNLRRRHLGRLMRKALDDVGGRRGLA